jgi:hypothetical protein
VITLGDGEGGDAFCVFAAGEVRGDQAMDNVLHFALDVGANDLSARLDVLAPNVSSAGSRYSAAPGVTVSADAGEGHTRHIILHSERR